MAYPPNDYFDDWNFYGHIPRKSDSEEIERILFNEDEIKKKIWNI